MMCRIDHQPEADSILPLSEDFQPIPQVERRPVSDQFAKGNSFTIPDFSVYWQKIGVSALIIALDR
ncbi:hypothetical protein [uncultured Megasphaera sp.]|mgnify:CR=1 FL=1|jgi:hypothetical protein|uniref:hypothetical protein n=1 Tax=uncultured Megasphaera sp. TaxID=165188 RepID=UPI002618289C|nr:hypothetical protein [uncultured Megasphaera sp.]